VYKKCKDWHFSTKTFGVTIQLSLTMTLLRMVTTKGFVKKFKCLTEHIFMFTSYLKPWFNTRRWELQNIIISILFDHCNYLKGWSNEFAMLKEDQLSTHWSGAHFVNKSSQNLRILLISGNSIKSCQVTSHCHMTRLTKENRI